MLAQALYHKPAPEPKPLPKPADLAQEWTRLNQLFSQYVSLSSFNESLEPSQQAPDTLAPLFTALFTCKQQLHELEEQCWDQCQMEGPANPWFTEDDEVHRAR